MPGVLHSEPGMKLSLLMVRRSVRGMLPLLPANSRIKLPVLRIKQSLHRRKRVLRCNRLPMPWLGLLRRPVRRGLPQLLRLREHRMLPEMRVMLVRPGLQLNKPIVPPMQRICPNRRTSTLIRPLVMRVTRVLLLPLRRATLKPRQLPLLRPLAPPVSVNQRLLKHAPELHGLVLLPVELELPPIRLIDLLYESRIW